MRGWILVLGVIIIFVGLLLIGISTATQTERTSVGTVYESWEATGGPFHRGDRLIVQYAQGANWRLPPYLPPEDPDPRVKVNSKGVIVNVSHALGGSTLFYDVWMPDRYQPTVKLMHKVLVYVEEGKNESLNLDAYAFEKLPDTGDVEIWRYYLDETGGIVKYDGYYNVTVMGPFPPPDPTEGPPDPPAWITLWREREVYPYNHVFLPGTALVLAGIAVTILGLVTKKPSRRRVGREKKG